MADNLWQPAQFRDTSVWVAVDDRGSLAVDGRGLVAFRYQLNGKNYSTRADRLAVTGEPAVAGPAPRPAEPVRPAAPAAAPTRVTHTAFEVEIWADGACSGNPGPAGLGVHLRAGGRVRELSEYLGEATNNIAELMAIVRGLEMIDDRAAHIGVMTDSEYSLGLLSKGWKPKKNQELVAELRALAARFSRVTFVKVAGHAGIAGNERADALARQAVATRSTTRTEQGI